MITIIKFSKKFNGSATGQRLFLLIDAKKYLKHEKLSAKLLSDGLTATILKVLPKHTKSAFISFKSILEKNPRKHMPISQAYMLPGIIKTDFKVPESSVRLLHLESFC